MCKSQGVRGNVDGRLGTARVKAGLRQQLGGLAKARACRVVCL